MNYYERWVGDFQRDTGHLSCTEIGVYDRLLDHYYATETLLPAEYDALNRIARAMNKTERDAVKSIADQFFPLSNGGRCNPRADREISKARNRIDAAKENGKKGGRKPKQKPNETQEEPDGFPVGTPPATQPGVHHMPHASKSSLNQKESTTTTTFTGNDPPMLLSLDFESRCKTVADLLTGLEVKRGVEFKFSPLEKRLVGWVQAGVTDPQLREAYDLALAQRVKDASPAAINYGFMDTFIRKVLQDDGTAVAPIPVKEWHETASGIEAKAGELGLSRRFDEAFPLFRARVEDAVKVAAGLNLGVAA